MTAPTPAPHIVGASSRARRLRLLAIAAAPLALAGAAMSPAAASSHASPPAAHPTSPGTGAPVISAAGNTPRTLALPGLPAASVVTLITGDQVTLTRTGPGKYLAGPRKGAELAITTYRSPSGRTNVQALPAAAAALISSGQVSRGLFDLTYLAAHGDTSPAGRVPVTIAYSGHPDAATLKARAAGLAGASLQAALPASGEVRLSVPAPKAAAFWNALTGGTATATAMRPPRLADGATRVSLTGHQTAADSPSPQDGQPLDTVTETITQRPGPLGTWACGALLQGVIGTFCPSRGEYLFGVAGGGTGNYYSPGPLHCTDLKPELPRPVCVGDWQLTYQVPPGVYYAGGLGVFPTASGPDGTLEYAKALLDVPQLTVTGPTGFTIDTRNLVPITVSTPQPASNYRSLINVERSVPDGAALDTAWLIGLNTGFFGYGNWWVLPTPPGEQTTIGSYALTPQLMLGRPPVTATVTSPEHLLLHPLYPAPSAFESDTLGPIVVDRFSGRQTLPVVNAGEGTTSDFSKIDATGKLALIQPDYANGSGGAPDPAALANAKDAGAAGVLYDLGTMSPTGSESTIANPVPLSVNGGPPPAIPFTEIDSSEADAVLSLLAHGPVTVTISDSGDTPYLYNVAPNVEGKIPGSLHYTITNRAFAEVKAQYHSIAPGVAGEYTAAEEPVDFGGSYIADSFAGPAAKDEFFGPVSPDQVWYVYGENEQLPVAQGPADLWLQFAVFDQPGRSTTSWNEQPVVPGGQSYADADQAQSDRYFGVCAGCRQGDTFWPIFDYVAGPNADAGLGIFAPVSGDGCGVCSMHLYGPDGQEIPPSQDAGVPVFDLPAQQQRYKLETQVQQLTSTGPPSPTTTTWDFTSSEPATDQTPAGTFCIAGFVGISSAPCTAPPMVFLRYDAALSLDNTITPGARQLQVTGYHQDPSAPAVTSLKLWTSTDGGKTWQAAQVTGGQGGTFTATYTVPASATGGYVSIRAQASDAGGNDVTQEIDNAYPIAAASGQASGPRA